MRISDWSSDVCSSDLAKRKKERFNMTLQRHIAQPSAVTRYAKLMADVESRFNRHVVREIAHGADIAAVDRVVQEHVVEPCVSAHSTSEGQITAGWVDGALYYLARSEEHTSELQSIMRIPTA